MRYIKTYEYYTPIKINNERPFKIDDKIADKIAYIQDSLKKLRKRVQNEKDRKTQAELNKEISEKVKRLSDLTFKQTKQVAYLKYNPIKESSDIEDNSPNLIEVLSSDNFKPEDIEKYIGFDENDAVINSDKEYQYPYESNPTYDDEGFTLIINSKVLEDLFDIEHNSLQFSLQFGHYNSYEYDVDKSELEYLGLYTKKEVNSKIVKLARLFGFKSKINPSDQGKIVEIFEYLDLTDDLETFQGEMSMAHERAVEEAAGDALKKLPFNINDNSNSDSDRQKYNIELIFEYKTIIEYMKKYKLEVKTIKEFLSNISDADELRPETIEYEDSYSYINYDDLSKSIDDTVDKYLDDPDKIFPIWIEKDNLDMFKKNEHIYLKFSEYDLVYDFWFISNRKRENLLVMAKLYNGKILEWFKTYDFQKKLIMNDMDNYKVIKNSGILNSKIENEFSYIVDVDKFNI